jgi:uncharacterized protein DUF3124
MRARFLGGLLVVAVAIALIWYLGDSDNPVRDAMIEGAKSSRELVWGDGPPPAERDPVAMFSASLAVPSAAPARVQGSVYVPAYAHIRLGSGRGRVDLATTLSIHNTSPETAIVLKRIAYHNTEGALVAGFLDKPVALKPLATIEVFITANDVRGGSGANFVVDWASPSAVSEPAVEAVMIGTIGTTSYSFVSQGRNLRLVSAE